MENVITVFATAPPSPESFVLKMKNTQCSPFVTQPLDVERL
jgi:hypothetical protein